MGQWQNLIKLSLPYNQQYLNKNYEVQPFRPSRMVRCC